MPDNRHAMFLTTEAEAHIDERLVAGQRYFVTRLGKNGRRVVCWGGQYAPSGRLTLIAAQHYEPQLWEYLPGLGLFQRLYR